MAQYPKPSSTSGTFNNSSFNNNQSGGLTISEGLKYFVSYPKTQTPSTIIADNFTTTGNLDVAGDSQFGGDVEFLGGVTITGGIIFKDDVEVQGTTTLDDTLLCLQTATIDGELTVNNNIVLNPSALTPTVAPVLELTNGVAGEYCQLYLDPQSGYDMTLYTNQNPGGGLTIRGANSQSFTMNPAAVQDGSGCRFSNPVDMNGNTLSGLINVYADGNNITFIDSSSAPMLQLSNGGHTSYENINMNYNQLSNVNNMYFGGNNCSISNQNNFNPNILTISNTTPYNTGSIYFQMLNSGGTSFSPLNITGSAATFTVPVNSGTNSITSTGAISGNTLTATTTVNGATININTYGKINQNSADNSTTFTNNAPYNAGQLANFRFNLTNSGGIDSTPMQIYVNGVSLYQRLNMVNNNITGINTLSGYNSAYIVMNTGLNMSNTAISGVSSISGNAGANITASNNIDMNNNSVLNMGINSTAYTQASSDNDTSVATTAFVNAAGGLTTTVYNGQFTGGNLNQSATTLTVVKNAISTSLVYNSGNLSVNFSAGTLLCSYINFPSGSILPAGKSPTVSQQNSFIVVTSASQTGLTYAVTVGGVSSTGFIISTSQSIIQATYDLYVNFQLSY